MKRCAKCKKDRDENLFQQLGWRIDRVTPVFHSYCDPCRRVIDRKRRRTPEAMAILKLKRKERYRLTGK